MKPEPTREESLFQAASQLAAPERAVFLNGACLDRHRPQPGEEDLRGWEWRYLWQLTRSSALVTLTNRPTTRGFDVSFAFSKDGRRLISASTDQSIRFWDTSTWTETKVLRGHSDEVHAAAISESAQLVASAGKDGNLMLWKEDGQSAADGYSRLPESLQFDQVFRLDRARALLLPSGNRRRRGKAPGVMALRG